MELIGYIIRFAFGLAVAGGLLAFIYKRHAVDWEALATVYGRSWQKPLEQKRLQSLVTYGPGRPAKAYKGLLSIGLYEEGVAFQLMPLFAPFHASVFVPYSDITGWEQKWYVDAKSVELEFRQAPDMRFIMPAEQAEWIRQASAGRVEMHEQPPAHGQWPHYTFWSAILLGIMGAWMLGFMLAKYFG